MTTKAKMLHTVNKSPFERNTLQSCLRLAKKGSAILLIEDGVYAALEQSTLSAQIKDQKDNFEFFVLGPDMIVRGISEEPLIDGIEVVDYSGFVDLVAKYDSVQSWL
jgi:tRNA 2-thiouridine synthesizing protein B